MKPRLRDYLRQTLNDEIVKAYDEARRKMTGLTHLIIDPDSAVFRATATVQMKGDASQPRCATTAPPKSEIVDAMRVATDLVKPQFDREKHEIVYEVWCAVGNNVHVPVPREFWKQHEYAATAL